MKKLLSIFAVLLWLSAAAEAQQKYDPRLMPDEVTQDTEIEPTGSTHICVSNTPGPTPAFALCNPLDMTGMTVLFKLPEYTVATLPATHPLAIVTDGSTATSCTSGGGANRVLCAWNGSAYAAIGGSGGGITAANVQSNLTFCATTGGDSPYTCNPLTPVGSYTDGMVIWVRFGAANVGAASITVSGIGNRDIRNHDGTVLTDNTLLANGGAYPLIYNLSTTNFRLLQDLTGGGGSGTVSGLSANCIPKAGSATTITACSGVTNPATNEWHLGDTTGNTIEVTNQTPTADRSHVRPDEDGIYAMKKIFAVWNADSIWQDETNCKAPTGGIINSGRRARWFTCDDVASATFEMSYPILPYDVATFFFHLEVSDVDSSSHVFSVSVAAACRAHGATFDNNFGTPVTLSITMATANVRYLGTSAAITPNGACPKYSDLYLKATVLNATTHTDDNDARVLAAAVEHAS